MNFLLVALGGALGSVLRYWVFGCCVSLRFPYATVLVNALGSLAIGFLAFWLINKFAGNELMRIFLLVGFLGGFTTFSAFSLDSLHLILAQRYWVAVSYMLGSVALCLGAVSLGMVIAHRMR